MANKIMGITIDIEGKTSGLTKSLQEANSQISKTSSALKDVNKALELDPGNVELIAQKEALLAKQIEQTNNKLEIMQQVATDANDALARGDISQEQYASLTAELSKTDVALEELQAEADGSADELNEVGEASGEAGHSLEALKGVAEAVGGAMAAAFAAAVAAAKEVGEALIETTRETSEYADEVMTMSSKTGLSTETLQELNYASELLDVNVETITGSMTKMEKSMGSAADKIFNMETKQAELNRQLKEGKISADDYESKMDDLLESSATGYDKLGISIYDANHNLRDSEEVFWETIDALGQMEDGTEKDLLAMELLGKSAKELNPLIEAGSDGFQKLADEAHETGYVMSDETLDAFGAFDDQMVRLNNATDNAKHSLGGVLLPLLGDLAGDGTDLLNEFSKGMMESGGDIDKMAGVISNMLPKVLQALLKQVPKIVEMISKMANAVIDTIVDNLPAILDAAMQIIDVLVKTLLTPENITKIVNSALQIIMTLANYLIQNLPMIISAAMQIIIAMINGITQALPQLIPTIIEVVVTVVHTLIDNLPMLLQAIMELVIAVAMAIIDNLPEIIDALVEVVTAVIEFLLSPEGIGLIAETGYKVFVALVEKLPEIIADILGGVGDIVDGILKAFGFDEGLGKGLTEIWNSIWDVIKGVINLVIGGINGFTGAIEDAVNFFVDGINVLIDGANALVGWIPGVSSHVVPSLGHLDIPDIPELAQGAVIAPNNPFLAVLGDQTTGTNIEAPLDTIKQALVEAMGTAGAGQEIIIPVYIGQDRIETIIAKANTNLNFISGGR